MQPLPRSVNCAWRGRLSTVRAWRRSPLATAAFKSACYDARRMDLASSASTPRWLGLRLSALFFLDVAVSAAYFPFLSLHLSKTLGLSATQIGLVYAMGPLTALIGPPIMGFVADRMLPAERSLALVGALRAVMLLFAADARSFPGILAAMAALGLVAAPAGVLSFTLAFHHLRDSRSIGKTRVWGTVSWICVLWATSAYMQRFTGIREQLSHTRSIFLFAAWLSLLEATYALSLPHTPPARGGGRAFVFLDALGLLRLRSYRGLVLGAALASACLQFHFMLWPLFYTDKVTGLGLDLSRAGWFSSLAQVLELGLFPALGLLIRRFGVRAILLVGIVAWPIRFAAYALGQPWGFVVGMQMLHGVNVVCFTMVTQIAVDRVAPPGARASSQALLATATSGFGNLFGQLSCGVVLGAFSLGSLGYAWRYIFALPLAIGLSATFIIWAGFRPERTPVQVSAS